MRTLSLLIFLLLQGCVSTLTLDPVALEGQSIDYSLGSPVTFSTLDQSTAAILFPDKPFVSKNQPRLTMLINNTSDIGQPFTVDDVEIYCDEKPLKVYSYEELVSEAKRKEAWANAFVGTAAGMNASNPNARMTHYSGTAYGNGEYYSYEGQSYSALDAQLSQSLANAETERSLQSIKQQANSTISGVQNVLRRKTVINPNGKLIADVVFDNIPSASKGARPKDASKCWWRNTSI